MGADTRNETLSRATTELRHGNLVVADLLAQTLLRAHPEDPLAHNLVGIIAIKLGLRAEALAAFERALTARPGDRAVQDNLLRTKSLPLVQPVGGERFLLIKAWGYGFWADANHLLGCLLLAEITGRKPVTHWSRRSLFSDGSGDDAFGHFFEPISDVSIGDLRLLKTGDVFPPHWSTSTLAHDDWTKLQRRGPGGIEFLGRRETLAVSDFYIGVIDLLPWIPQSHMLHRATLDQVYCYLTEKYLRPVQYITETVARFHREHLFGRKTMAIHVRGSDKATEFVQLDAFNTEYFSHLDAEPGETLFYLMTEDARLLEAFRRRYGNRIVATQSQRTTNDTGPHHLAGVDRKHLGYEVLVDARIGLHCDGFLGNGRSNVSATIEMMKAWDGKARLLAPSQLREPNLHLYGGVLRQG